jgi:hypothetical protein
MTTPAPTGTDPAARRAAVDSPCTLNGQPARITGYLNPYATVTDLRTGLSCQWAWETVHHILCNRDGRFQS